MPIKPDNFPKGSNKLLERNKYGHSIGKNPLSTGVNSLKNAGHTSMSAPKIMRKKCLDCCDFQVGEVRKCVSTDCALWPYRMGKNPFLAHKRKGKGNYGKGG